MIRVIYLQSLTDPQERARLVNASVSGHRWTVRGSRQLITDAQMARTANQLHGWAASVYRFGCSFIHLSAFHDYSDRDPLQSLPDDEKSALLGHLRFYHHGPNSEHPTFTEVVPYLPAVFDKIASNLDCHLQELEAGESTGETN